MTDAIFEQLEVEVEDAQADPSVLRLSLDAKAVVKIGPFSRGGTSRTDTQGCDHDFHPKASVTPYGIFLPELDEVFLYLATSKVTSDFMADMLEAWWDSNRERFAHIKTLLIVNSGKYDGSDSGKSVWSKSHYGFVSSSELKMTQPKTSRDVQHIGAIYGSETENSGSPAKRRSRIDRHQ